MQSTCAQCQTSFEITDDDLAFYDHVSPTFEEKKWIMPPPKLCPDCRRQRKLAWRNERTLYPRTCDLCKKNIVSVHDPKNPYPVFCSPCWWSDTWDALSFGRPFDPERSFIEQYGELYRRTPQRAMVNDDNVTSENCAYTFDVAFSKNCYLCFGMWKAQDCLYCRICDQSKFCVDCEGVKLGSELVYESVDSQRLYQCAFLQNSESCRECFFGFDLKACSDCLGCAGLRQKQFCIFNQQYSEEEYKRLWASYALGSYASMERFKQQFQEFIRNIARKNMNLQNCENCSGDHLFNCRDVHSSFVCTNMEHCRWIERSDGPVWSYDIVQAGAPQWCYESITVDDGYMDAFCLYCNQSRNVLYGDNCLSCSSLIGCISLRRKQYCILNRPYKKEEFERVASSVLSSMQRTGEWGEFFPIALSPYAYNETNAQEFFPSTKDDVLAKGWAWKDSLPYTTGKETLPPALLPDNIADAPASICDEILACVSCQKNYKVIPQEFEFYKTIALPLPRKCSDCRNIDRLARRNPQRLWSRACGKCGKGIETTYAPDRPAVRGSEEPSGSRREIVYCESCYLKEVY